MNNSYQEALNYLQSLGQEHVLEYWESLDNEQRSSLLKQVYELDGDLLKVMASELKSASSEDKRFNMEPADVVRRGSFDETAALEAGEDLLRAGSVGALLVAGGQGSRLGFDGPKGSFPIAPITEATLFEIHSRKILALERKYSTEIPFYIMTSKENDAPTKQFFGHHDFFGLSPERVIFFSQGMWPALWPDGKLVLDRPDHIFKSPNGHGGMVEAMAGNGIIQDADERGLEMLFYFQVDNPLVEIADPVFLGLHDSRASEMSAKVCMKRDPGEGLGVIVRKDGKLSIVEYSELTEEQKNEKNSAGELRFGFGSVAIHVFSVPFLKREAGKPLPLHVAHKKVPYWIPEEGRVKPEKPNAYKFERFIFDLLPCAKETLVLEFDRDMEFSPVKNATGNDSPETAKIDISRKFARWMESCGIAVPRDPDGRPAIEIEIDPCFAVSAADLKKRLTDTPPMNSDLLLKE